MPHSEEVPMQALEEPEESCILPHFESFYTQHATHQNAIDMTTKIKYDALKTLPEQDCKDFGLPSLDEPDKDYANLLPVSEMFTKFLEKPADLSSWTKTHPHEWKSQEVLDFIYQLADVSNGPSGLRGENFQTIEGSKLCEMTCEQLKELEPNFGQTIYDQLQVLLKTSDFQPPKPVDATTDLELQGSPMDLSIMSHQQFSFMRDLHSLHQTSDDDDLVYALNNVTNHNYFVHPDSKQHVFLNSSGGSAHSGYCSPIATAPQLGQSQPSDGTFVYDFDATDKFDDQLDDSGYTSSAGSSTSSQLDGLPDGVPTLVLQAFQNDLESTPSNSLPGYQACLHKKVGDGGMVHKRRGRPSKRERMPSDSSCDGEQHPAPKTRGRKPGQMSKGNHLWEFIRDLLKDLSYSTIIKWENQEEGVFRILKSAEVSKLWGKKKNNPNMNYEKLSRAMRFCRCEGYFGDVPKDGRFPKKLCFRFGERAFGWK